MTLNVAALDTRIKATIASTMYDMTKVNSNRYFDEGNRYDKKVMNNKQRTVDFKTNEYQCRLY